LLSKEDAVSMAFPILEVELKRSFTRLIGADIALGDELSVDDWATIGNLECVAPDGDDTLDILDAWVARKLEDDDVAPRYVTALQHEHVIARQECRRHTSSWNLVWRDHEPSHQSESGECADDGEAYPYPPPASSPTRVDGSSPLHAHTRAG
jgi:hypothetical protein